MFYSHDGELEYDFVVKPGADPKQIRLSFEGQQRMRVDDTTGDLVLTTAGGRELRQRVRTYTSRRETNACLDPGRYSC